MSISDIKKSLDINGNTMGKVLKEQKIKDKINGAFYAPPATKDELQMLMYQHEMEQEERHGLHASAVVGAVGKRGLSKAFCYREQVLSIFFKRNDGDSRSAGINLQRIFEHGTMIGQKYQRLFIRGGLGKKEDMDIPIFFKDYDLIYTPDAKVTIDGVEYTVELKSMNNNQFTTQKGHKKGEDQLKIYMFFEMLRKKEHKKQCGFVLRENKDTQDFDIIIIEMNESDFEADERFQIILDALKQIQVYKNYYLENGKMVKKHIQCTSAQCPKAQRCPMREACWGLNRRKIDD